MSLLQRTASALAGDRTGKSDLNLDQIRTDGGTQPRAEINWVVVRDYADALTNGVELPAVTVFYDGTSYWLADGYHRLAAHKMADKRSILADVRQGTQREAVLWSVGANAEHGLRRTDEDKRRAVLRLLEDQEWGGWSDREIARQCKVSPTMVGKLRSGLTVHVDSEQPQERTYTTKHGTQATMRTAPIAAASAERATRRIEQKPTWGDALGWLAGYRDGNGRAWRDLTDNQVYHANSPCFRAFVKAFPSFDHPKEILSGALTRLRADAEVTQRIKDAERLYVKVDQQAEPPPAQPGGIFPDRRLGRLAASLASAITSLDDEDLRSVAASINVGMAYGDIINELRRLHQLSKLALRQ